MSKRLPRFPLYVIGVQQNTLFGCRMFGLLLTLPVGDDVDDGVIDVFHAFEVQAGGVFGGLGEVVHVDDAL